MAFTGTLDKCKACDKTVYFVDLLSADGVTYHKSCFKCSHCKGTLVQSQTEIIHWYAQMRNISTCLEVHYAGYLLYIVHNNMSFNKLMQTRAPSKLSSMFSGTQDKCSACNKTVYPLEKVTMEGESFHKSCFKCAHGGCPLTHSSYAALDGILYCKHHFAQLFMEKGTYSHVLEAATHRRSAVVLVEPEAAEAADHEAQAKVPEPDEQTQE
ncbi:hypothetical protein RJ639_039280 [Escallonia herrerae]|uniref:LIM zinc-binding domain-containing protein n=1 Tax=Escallonia herrerae TaxID=1293975 RepID=A0AA88WNV5_9ASTE|nr:hypothetical protein RJ639_039280 [Escallonia herrerae]